MHDQYLPALLLAACLGVSSTTRANEACRTYGADLAAMTSADQALRKRLDLLGPESSAQVKLRAQLMLVDRTNTERLKAWVARCGWPTRSKYGEQAAGDAWLLAQHADHDIAFQKKALISIEQAAAESRDGVTSNFAYPADRVAVAERRPQPYGTQLESKSDQPCDLDFSPLEEREKVEARRAALKLPRLDDYKRLVLDMQKCPVDSPKIKSVNGVPVEPFKDYHYAPPAPDSPAREDS